MSPAGAATARYGLSFPLGGSPLAGQRDVVEQAEALGYTDLWSSEVDGVDAFTPLALAATWSSQLRLGTAIASVFTRGPALLAMSAAALAGAAPDRFVLGIGASSAPIVELWNDGRFERPYHRVRDTISFVRTALTGERIDHEYETFNVSGFRLAEPPATAPPIMVAALRSQMVHLARYHGDGVILNWVSPDDVRNILAADGPAPSTDVVARLFVVVGTDPHAIATHARRFLATYLNVPTYAEFHRALGRGPALAEMWARWERGDRRGALDAIPDSVIDELFVHGSPDQCHEQIAAYVDAGVTTPVLSVVDLDGDLRTTVNALAPRS